MVRYRYRAAQAPHQRNCEPCTGDHRDRIDGRGSIVASNGNPCGFCRDRRSGRSGIVPSLARPGKNITGFTAFEPEITGKWLALLKELAPNVKRAALIFHPESPFGESFWRAFQVAAPSAGITAVRMAVRDAAEIERNIAQFSQGGDGGLLGVPEVIISMHRGLIFRLAAQHRLPAIYPYRFHAAEGGLASYGIDTGDMWRRSASYVDRILKGEKPADLPVQAPTKFEYVINLRTARALGLDIPPALQTRADEVIE